MTILLTLILLLTALPAWAFDAATRRFSLPPGATGIATPFIFPDFGENCTAVPCAAIFIVTRATIEDTHADDAMLSIGFADGINQVVTFAHDDNAAGTSDGVRSMRNDRIIEAQESTGVTGIAEFYDWTSTGLRINIIDDFPGAYLVTVVIIGGDNVMAKAGTFTSNATLDGTTDVNTVGFEPDAVLLSSSRLATVNSGSTTYVWSMGSAVSDASSSQGSISCFSEHAASATYDARALTSTTYAMQTVTSTGLGTAVLLDGWDAQGFTATTKQTGLAAANHYLALKFGGPSSTVLDIDTRITLGLSSHALGYKPLFGMVLGTLAQAYGVLESDTDGSQCMISFFTENNQYANGVSVRDGAGATTTTYSVSNDQGIMMESNAGTCDAGTCFRGHEFVENTLNGS